MDVWMVGWKTGMILEVNEGMDEVKNKKMDG